MRACVGRGVTSLRIASLAIAPRSSGLAASAARGPAFLGAVKSAQHLGTPAPFWHDRSFSTPAASSSGPTVTDVKSTALHTPAASAPIPAAPAVAVSTSAPAASQSLTAASSPVRKREAASIPASLTSPFPPLAQLPGMVLSTLLRLLRGTVHYTGVFVQWTLNALWTAITDPAAARAKLAHLWTEVKHEAHHYWVGSKLLVAETRTSAALLRTVGRGKQLTRRERLQLKRSVGDLLRMVPFVVILIVPFAEFSLPVLLKLFPNMLPSQFEKAEYRQEVYRKSLNVKLELHGILQEVLHDRIARAAEARNAPSVEQLMQQLEDVRSGKPLPPDAVVAVARLFKDEITIDNMPRGQLAVLAKYMGLSPFTPEPILRYQMRSSLRAIKEDDRDIGREGTASLSLEELRSACETRGMRVVDMQEEGLRAQLDDWLYLRLEKEVPVTLMMLSRGFQIAGEMGTGASGAPEAVEKAIQESISSMDENIVTEVVLATADQHHDAAAAAVGAATEPLAGSVPLGAAGAPSTAAAAGAASSAASRREAETEVLELKLESIAFQNDLIAAEGEAAASDAASEAARLAAADKASAAAAAKQDPSLGEGDIAALAAAATSAAAEAAAKQQLAVAKAQVVFRLKAADAVRGAASAASDASASGVRAKASTDAAAAAAASKETEALRSVAVSTSTAREGALLEKIKAFQHRIEAAELLQSRGRDVAAAPAAASSSADTPAPAAAPAPVPEDRGTALLKAQLQSMVPAMEADLERMRSSIKRSMSAALTAADVDKDGSLNESELNTALRRVLGDIHTKEAAAALIKRLDRDNDGEITLDSLQRFLDGYHARLEHAEEAAAAAEGAEEAVAAGKHRVGAAAR